MALDQIGISAMRVKGKAVRRSGHSATNPNYGSGSRLAERTTDILPAKVTNGISHRLNEGTFGIIGRRKRRPAMKLQNTFNSGLADGHRPTQTTPTRIPKLATVRGIQWSPVSEITLH